MKKKYEYMIIYGQILYEKDLNSWGKEGWELVSVVDNGGGGFKSNNYFFKRELNEQEI